MLHFTNTSYQTFKSSENAKDEYVLKLKSLEKKAADLVSEIFDQYFIE